MEAGWTADPTVVSTAPTTDGSAPAAGATAPEPPGDERFGAFLQLALDADHGEHTAGGHPARVGRTAMAIAARLGLGGFQAAWLVHAAPLHDIGKLTIPSGILAKPSPLSYSEAEIVKFHTVAGAGLLIGGGSRLLALAREIALSHHERWDGTGYPYELAGEQIPLSGRIVAVADVFDALTHARPYQEAWSIEEAIAEIRARRGSQFDPMVVDAFLAGIGEQPLARPELAIVR
jgi:putative two-component system response regulator